MNSRKSQTLILLSIKIESRLSQCLAKLNKHKSFLDTTSVASQGALIIWEEMLDGVKILKCVVLGVNHENFCASDVFVAV